MRTTVFFFFISSRRRHTRLQGDWSSDVCSSDLRPSISASLQEACITEPKGARHCPGCSQPIERVDLAVFDAGALFHRKCFVQGGGAYNLVHEFLRRHYPSAFCARYLSRTLDIPYEQAQNVLAALRIDGH